MQKNGEGGRRRRKGGRRGIGEECKRMRRKKGGVGEKGKDG